MFTLQLFFFQAEDGIRYKLVTGVQTCALPILKREMSPPPTAAEGVAPASRAAMIPGLFLTGSEAAAFVRLSPDKIDDLVRSSAIPFIDLTDLSRHRPGARVKRLIRFSRESLTAWMMSREKK